MTLEEISQARAAIARRRAELDRVWAQLPYMFIAGLLAILALELAFIFGFGFLGLPSK